MQWRGDAAISDMNCRLAAKKLNQMIMKDGQQFDEMLTEVGKVLECLEAAHEAAMKVYNEIGMGTSSRFVAVTPIITLAERTRKTQGN
jgi:hypothetical protein